jgi:hypothetical protein
VVRITAQSATRVVIDLKTPFAPFRDALTHVNLAPVSPVAAKKEGADFGAHPVAPGRSRSPRRSPDSR